MNDELYDILTRKPCLPYYRYAGTLDEVTPHYVLSHWITPRGERIYPPEDTDMPELPEALPLPEVFELHYSLTERPNGRCRIELRAPGYRRLHTFDNERCAKAYAAFIARRLFGDAPRCPTLFE